jgi:uncharacterized membrane protein
MFDTFNGLPIHPLVVHGVVVLLPLAIVGTIAIAVRPSWRAKYGLLVLIATVIATALIPVSTQSGEQLEKRVGNPGEHAELGDQLLWFALPLLVLAIMLVVLDRYGTQGGLTTVVSVLAVIAAVAAGVQCFRVGDSGARAAWGDRVSSAP